MNTVPFLGSTTMPAVGPYVPGFSEAITESEMLRHSSAKETRALMPKTVSAMSAE
jgi:hypothetical protein